MEISAKYGQVKLGTFDSTNCFYFSIKMSTSDADGAVFFVIRLSAVAILVLAQKCKCSSSLSNTFTLLASSLLNCDKASHIQILTKQSRKSQQHNLTMIFLVILILNEPYHQTHFTEQVEHKLQLFRHNWSYQFFLHFLFYLSTVSSPLRDKKFESDGNISCRIDKLIIPFYNKIHRLV